MTEPESRWSDKRLDTVLGNLLRAGVLLATVVVLLGGVVYLTHEGHEVHDLKKFHGEPEELKNIGGIVRDAWSDGKGIIQLGILILLATPIVRVAYSIVAFGLQRDWIYVVVTLIVFAVLMYGLLGGKD